MKIYLHFTGTNSVSFGAIEDVVNEIQQIAVEQEKATLRQIRKQIPEIPSQAVTAAIAELETPLVQHQSVQLLGVRPGSVGVWIAVTAFGYWVLDKTLGKTLEDAWTESPAHGKLKEFFLQSRADKLRAIQRALNKGIQKLKPRDARKNVEIEVPMHAQLNEAELELSVRIECDRGTEKTEAIPTYEELTFID